MTRSMADSVTATDIPPGRFDLVAGYVDGLYRWTDADWLFHHASRLVRIAVDPHNHDADVLDVENGDATPADAGNWLAVEVAVGHLKTLYFSASLFGAVHAAALANGVKDGQWAQWVADWDGVAVLPPGPIAKQYANPTLSGGHYDLSVVADYWPGVDPPPATPQSPVVIPPVSTPPPDSIPPFQTSPPPAVGGIDQTRGAWANLAAFVTQDLPAFVAELLRLLGLYRKTP